MKTASLSAPLIHQSRGPRGGRGAEPQVATSLADKSNLSPATSDRPSVAKESGAGRACWDSSRRGVATPASRTGRMTAPPRDVWRFPERTLARVRLALGGGGGGRSPMVSEPPCFLLWPKRQLSNLGQFVELPPAEKNMKRLFLCQKGSSGMQLHLSNDAYFKVKSY